MMLGACTLPGKTITGSGYVPANRLEQRAWTRGYNRAMNTSPAPDPGQPMPSSAGPSHPAGPVPGPSAHSPWHAVEHTENFPVGSWLVPARLRGAVVAVYHFARHADDLADEGDAPVVARETALLALDAAVQQASRGTPSGIAVVDGLMAPAARHGLDWQCFRDLIDAFRQDLRVTRYARADDVQDYCRRSADPVGRLMLQLYGADTPDNRRQADAICSALQRINFLQDIGIDAGKDRVYLPEETLAAAGSSAAQLLAEARAGRLGAASRLAVQREWQRAQAQLQSGVGLTARLPWRLAAELRFIIAGGQRILDRIAGAGYDAVAHRPALGWRDAPALLGLALRPRRR